MTANALAGEEPRELAGSLDLPYTLVSGGEFVVQNLCSKKGIEQNQTNLPVNIRFILIPRKLNVIPLHRLHISIT